MSEELIHVSIAGLKCDNEACDYEDNTVKFENYEQYLNKPCPKCGESLLTPEDMKSAKALMEMSAILNDLGDELGEMFPGIDADGEHVDVELKMKGDGSIEFGEIK